MNLAGGDSRCVHRYTNEGFIGVRSSLTGVGQKAHPVRLHAIGDPHFAAWVQVEYTNN